MTFALLVVLLPLAVCIGAVVANTPAYRLREARKRIAADWESIVCAAKPDTEAL